MMFFNSKKRKERKEEKCRKKDAKLVKKLDALDWEGRKANRLYKKHIKMMDKIEKNRTWSLPKREHGWYLPNDD